MQKFNIKNHIFAELGIGNKAETASLPFKGDDFTSNFNLIESLKSYIDSNISNGQVHVYFSNIEFDSDRAFRFLIVPSSVNRFLKSLETNNPDSYAFIDLMVDGTTKDSEKDYNKKAPRLKTKPTIIKTKEKLVSYFKTIIQNLNTPETATEDLLSGKTDGVKILGENFDSVKNYIKANINAPYVGVSLSTLGGAHRASLFMSISLDPKETWKHNIFENSQSFKIGVDYQGIVEQISGKRVIKIRKKVVKNKEELVAYINKNINTLSSEQASSPTREDFYNAYIKILAQQDFPWLKDKEKAKSAFSKIRQSLIDKTQYIDPKSKNVAEAWTSIGGKLPFTFKALFALPVGFDVPDEKKKIFKQSDLEQLGQMIINAFDLDVKIIQETKTKLKSVFALGKLNDNKVSFLLDEYGDTTFKINGQDVKGWKDRTLYKIKDIFEFFERDVLPLLG